MPTVNGMNSKQIVSAISVAVVLIILIYPTLSTGTVSVTLKSSKISNAEHVYVTLKDVWAHQTGQSESEGWRIISNSSRTIDLVSLQTVSMILADGKVPVGRYDSVRVNLANVTWVSSGTAIGLQLEASQLSSKVDFTVQTGKNLVVIIMLGGFQETLQGQRFFSANLSVIPSDAS
jgi:hypothetical protein